MGWPSSGKWLSARESPPCRKAHHGRRPAPRPRAREGLQVQPAPRIGAEVPRQTERSVRRDSLLATNDRADVRLRHGEGVGGSRVSEPCLPNSERPHRNVARHGSAPRRRHLEARGPT